ncbi:MAG: hypothetical protein J0L52_12270 [Caulobacterales bacterium]|nr:hypothetical protein [Caulobacterales bacterium]
MIALVTLTACTSGVSLLSEAVSPDGRFEARLLNCNDPASIRGRELVGIVYEAQGQAPACRETNLPHVRAWFAAAAPEGRRSGSVAWIGDQAHFTLPGNEIKSQTPPPEPGGLIMIVGAAGSDDEN